MAPETKCSPGAMGAMAPRASSVEWCARNDTPSSSECVLQRLRMKRLATPRGAALAIIESWWGCAGRCERVSEVGAMRGLPRPGIKPR